MLDASLARVMIGTVIEYPLLTLLLHLNLQFPIYYALLVEKVAKESVQGEISSAHFDVVTKHVFPNLMSIV